MRGAGRIRVGVGGWTYEGWRGTFFPKGLPHARELGHASRRLTTLEINATFYRTFKPATFRKWRDEVPEGFVFSVKAPAFASQRRDLAGAGDAIARFLDSGLVELGDALGPILWQLAPGKRFDAGELASFLGLLPESAEGRALRHVLEVRHASFAVPGYVELARRHAVATVFADSDEYPSFADSTGGLVYARLMRSRASLRNGYAPQALDRWAAAARTWAAGGTPKDLTVIAPLPAKAKAKGAGAARGRDVFLYFIDSAKEKAPAAAEALLARLS
jgi:uncharacterized protein YecE (DUF72 family)